MSDSMELEPVLVPAKRGRPRKDSPLMIDNVELLSGEERAQHYRDVAELHRGMKQLRQTVRDLTKTLCSIGQRMAEIQGRYFGKLKVEDYTRLLEISPAECRAAKCVYLAELNSPGFLDSDDVQDFTSVAQVLRYFRTPQEERKELPQVQYPAAPAPQWSQTETLPCKSGARLNRYRIRAEPTDGQFYVYHNDDAPYPAVSLGVEIPRNFQQETAFERMRDKIQVALEEYYSVVEATEEDWG